MCACLYNGTCLYDAAAGAPAGMERSRPHILLRRGCRGRSCVHRAIGKIALCGVPRTSGILQAEFLGCACLRRRGILCCGKGGSAGKLAVRTWPLCKFFAFVPPVRLWGRASCKFFNFVPPAFVGAGSGALFPCSYPSGGRGWQAESNSLEGVSSLNGENASHRCRQPRRRAARACPEVQNRKNRTRFGRFSNRPVQK